MDSLD